MMNPRHPPAHHISALFLWILATLAPVCAYAAAGDLDPSFGSGGKVVTNFFGSSDEANAVALQADGKIVVVGENGTDFLVARYNTDGSLDSSFGTGGKITTDFGAEDTAQAVAIQPDGKIIVVGHIVNGSISDFALARYNPNGSLDTGFGGGGKLITDFGGYDAVFAVALQPDGKLIAGGGSITPSNLGDFALARYNSNGTLDLSFGVAGLQRTSFGAFEVTDALALQSDGKILASGFTATVSLSDANFALARYNSNGTLDTGFGLGGGVTTDFGGFDDASGIKLQADGKIVVAGYTGGSGGLITGDFAMARYTPSGNLDTGFGTGGKVATDFGADDGGAGLAIQADGKIIAVGVTGNTANGNFALARYNTNGSLDTTFGSGGKRTTDFGRAEYPKDVVLQPDGKFVVVGASFNSSVSDGDFAIARYLGDSGLPQPGWWWNPDQSGRGFTIEVRGNNLFMAGYLYAADGRATWLVSGGPMTNVSSYSGPLMAFGGGQTLTGPYKPNTPTNSNAGTLTLQFSDASHGTLTWPGGTMSIERFPIGSGTASFQPESGWWWNEAESGRGFAIEVQGNNLFMAGYMYDGGGNPIWYVSPGGMVSPTLYQGSWLQFANGQTLTGTYKPPSQPPANAGAVTLQFTSTATAILTLPDGRQIPLTRFLF